MVSILAVIWLAVVMYMIVGFCDGEKVIEINQIPIQKKRGECVSFRGLHYYSLLPNQTFKWHKYAIQLPAKSLSHVTVHNEDVTIAKLTPSDSALYYSEVQTEGGKEITRYWLTVKDCDINEMKTSLKSNCDVKNSEESIACEVKCEAGWHYFKDKCFKYVSSPKDWENAHSFCQSKGARLATIESEDENTFVGNLLQTGDGGWIGLNDKSQESTYIWNYQRDPRPTFFAWDKSNPKNEEPNNNNRGCNVENCVELKYPSKKWNDAVCNAHFGYICQIYSTEENLPGWKCIGSKCYKYNQLRVAWDEARAACMGMNATLVTITSSSENNDVASMIKGSVWIGLNDRAEAGTYVWNDVGVDQFQNKATYFKWDSTEPNDKVYDKLLPRCTGEDCVQIRKWNGSVTWSDLGCSTTLPFVCEKRKDMYISFAAWIAITMGTGLVISIVAARGYMEYKSKRGRKEVKTVMIAENTNSYLTKRS